MPIGAMVTLRGERMWEFLDRLISVALPRVRDFRGVSPRGFDGRGNYTLGLKDQLLFPEIDYMKVDKARGMNISVVTTAKSDQESRKAAAAARDAVQAELVAYDWRSSSTGYASCGDSAARANERASGWDPAQSEKRFRDSRNGDNSQDCEGSSKRRSSRSGCVTAASAAAVRAPTCASSRCAACASASWRSKGTSPA